MSIIKGIGDIIGKIGSPVLGIVKETSDPDSKISSKKSAASVLLFIAGNMSMIDPMSTNQLVLTVLFTLCGTLLLALSMLPKKITKE